MPRIGVIRTKEKTSKFRGRVLSATIKREADRWYVSLHTEIEREIPILNHAGVIGIDCNAGALVTSEGEVFELPKPLKKYLKLLRRRSKQHSRKQKGSHNRRKSAIRLARLYRKIKNIRLDFYHKLSTHLAKTKRVVVVESLNIEGMVQDHNLSQTISDAGWGTFLRMLEYKTTWYGSVLLRAPTFYPSTKRCSGCGYVVDEIPLSWRIFSCPRCGLTLDRDLNAALNLRNWALSPTGSSPGSHACGDRLCGGTVGSVYEHPVAEAGILGNKIP